MTTPQHIPSDYKPSPLGLIPEDWEVKRLGEVCTFLSTNTLSRNQLNDTNGEVRNIHYGDVLIKYPSIIDVRKQSIPFVNQEDYKESMNDFIEDGDVVLADTAEDETVGKACEIANVGSEKILSGLHTMLIRPQKGLFSPWFLGYQVNSVSYRKQLNALVQGIKVCSLGKQAIANTYFAVPPLPEQQRIVSVLSHWDTAIEKQTALIEKLILRKRGLMQQLLTGKKRLKGFEGEWKKCAIKSFAKEVSIKNTYNKDYIVLSCTKYDGLVPSLEYFGKQIYSNDLSTYKVVPKNHFAYATNHIEEGSIGYQAQYDNGLISPMYTVFKTDKEKIDNTYFFAVLKSHHLIHLYQAMMEGSINRRGGLRWDSFSTIKVDLPSLEEQKAISAFLYNADKEIEIQKQKLAAMQAQKKGLMQVLLTGKRRIK
jgi:type I restriction enzyme S subunit